MVIIVGRTEERVRVRVRLKEKDRESKEWHRRNSARRAQEECISQGEGGKDWNAKRAEGGGRENE